MTHTIKTWRQPVEADSILEALENQRVLAVTKHADGLFLIEERCDANFGVFLTPDQLKTLGRELIAIAEQA